MPSSFLQDLGYSSEQMNRSQVLCSLDSAWFRFQIVEKAVRYAFIRKMKCSSSEFWNFRISGDSCETFKKLFQTKYQLFQKPMVKIVNGKGRGVLFHTLGQIVEKESSGLIASIIAFFASIITFITNLYVFPSSQLTVQLFNNVFRSLLLYWNDIQDQKPTSTTGGRYTVKTANQNKWKYNPRDFGEGGLNRRIGTLQSHREASQLPGCGGG